MTSTLAALVIMASSLHATVAPAETIHEYTYVSVDVPGAVATTAFGINGDRDLVGAFVDSSNRQHGFRLHGTAYTTIDYPGASSTAARGIAPNGDIVGNYRYASEPPVGSHGYLLTAGGEFRTADFPGHLHTIAQRILPNGVILGCYHDNDTMGSMHGIVLSPHEHSEVDMMASMNNGATPDLTMIVGSYYDMTAKVGRAYTIIDGNFVPFDAPGARFTAAWDASPAGLIVGIDQDTNGGTHGFVFDEGHFQQIDFPDALETRVFGINERGDLAGSYVDRNKKTHAFLAMHILHPPAERGEVQDRSEP